MTEIIETIVYVILACGFVAGVRWFFFSGKPTESDEKRALIK